MLFKLIFLFSFVLNASVLEDKNNNIKYKENNFTTVNMQQLDEDSVVYNLKIDCNSKLNYTLLLGYGVCLAEVIRYVLCPKSFSYNSLNFAIWCFYSINIVLALAFVYCKIIF